HASQELVASLSRPPQARALAGLRFCGHAPLHSKRYARPEFRWQPQSCGNHARPDAQLRRQGKNSGKPPLADRGRDRAEARRRPGLSRGYDFVATLRYVANDTLALSFGGSRSLAEITPDQMRSFADKARIPASPLWKIAVETAQKTAAGWESLEQADLLPKDLRASIQKQILRIAATVK